MVPSNQTCDVVLRTAGLEDAVMLLEWECSAEVLGVTRSDEQLTLDFVCRHILSAQNLERDRQQRWVVETADHYPIGILDLYDYASGEAWIGIYICAEARGRGYATQALRRVVLLARGRGVRRLRAEVHSTNVSSLALFARLGFKIDESTDSPSIVSLFLDL